MTLNTYLFFDGNCKDAFEFYRSVFGGEFDTLMTYGDGPPDMEVPDENKDQIMHVSLPVGSSVLMGSDRWYAQPEPFAPGTNFGISILAENPEQSDDLFTKLSDGGTVKMKMEKVFWGAYFGSLTDRFGIDWMINCELPAESPV